MSDCPEHHGPKPGEVGESEMNPMEQSPLFFDLSPDEIGRFHDFISEKSFEKDALIIEQDTPGDSFFILMNGRLKVFRRGEYDEVVVLGEVLPGECIGEKTVMENSRMKFMDID